MAAAALSAEGENTKEEDDSLELGDRIIVLGGRLDGTRGRVYYLDPDRIRILPDGVSDRLVEIRIIDGDLDPEMGVEDLFIVAKRATPSFVAQIDAQVGYFAETFSETGEPGPTYTIKEINEAADTMVLEGPTEERLELDFEFGIPLDQSFAVLRPREPPTEGGENGATEAENLEAEEGYEAVEFQEEGAEGAEAGAPNAGPGPSKRRREVLEFIDLPPSQRTYSDLLQREDAIHEFMSFLSVNAQKNPRKLRDIRKLVEQFMILRNELISYSDNGEPEGRIPSSFQTVAELLEQIDIPLSRPVLDTKRTIFYQHDPEGNDITEAPEAAITVNYLDTVLKRSNNFIETQLAGASEEGAAAAAAAEGSGAVPAWYLGWESFFKQFLSPWTTHGEEAQEVGFQGDKEFFMAPAPREDQEPEVDGLGGKISHAYMRGVGPRYTRLKSSGPQVKIESGDEAAITNQLLFPLSVQRDLGTTRSGSLAKDIAQSHATMKTVTELVEQLGGVPAVASAGGILSIGVDGNTSGNIPIEEWIRSQPLLIKGLGEAFYDLKNLGLVQKELTVVQQEVLIEKIKDIRAMIRDYIKEERERAGAELANLRLESAPLLQGEALEEFFEVLKTEPALAPRVQELKARLPAYAEADIAIFAGLNAVSSDLLMATLAGVPGPLAKERTRYVRDQFIDALRKAMLREKAKEMSGEEPRPIRCIHTADLEVIQKTPYNEDRMKLMIKFLARYKRSVEDNWVMCSQGKHRLMCYHEALLLQEYAHPREQERIHKELLLTFSGGVFHGRYMCKNCGQPIADIDFDTGMEFDDEGRPMAGRGGLASDEGGSSVEAIERALADAEEVEELNFETDMQTKIYRAAKDIFQAVGIYADRADYMRVVQRVDAFMQQQPSQVEYSRAVQAKIAAKKMKASDSIEYHYWSASLIVCATAVHVLIEIQTHAPDYIPRYRVPGCVASFSGYPFGSEKDMSAMQYITCGVSGIKRDYAPWNEALFGLISSEKKRQEDILGGMTKVVGEAVKSAAVQQLFVGKRAFIEKVYGAAAVDGERLPENIPPGFRPVPYAVTDEEAAAAAAAAPVVAAGAVPAEAVRAWIQTGHKLARQNGVFVQGSPFSDTSCCFKAIDAPRGFWGEAAGLPELPARARPTGQQGSQTMVHFKPRRLAHVLANPPEELFYRVFLKVCYTGPRVGLPHEIGYTHKCVHCGFVFPEDPYTPNPGPPISADAATGKAMMKEWQAEIDSIVGRGKAALEAQRVTVTRATFEEVLDASHRAYRVEQEERTVPLAGMKILQKLLAFKVPLFAEWRTVMSDTLIRVNALTAGADQLDVANAYGPLSEVMVDKFAEIQRRLGPAQSRVLKTVVEQSPAEVAETLRSYMLMPITRLLVGFRPESLFIQSSYELPSLTRDPLQKIMASHFAYLGLIRRHVKGGMAIKLKWLQVVLQELLPVLQDELREDLIPGGAVGLPFLVGAMVIGALEEFSNPTIIPIDMAAAAGLADGASPVEVSPKIAANVLDALLSRVAVEGVNYTAEEIKKIVAKGAEDEKLTFISQFARLTPEEKKVALRIKRLGLKEWALGGTKAVRTLDPRILERERARREEMGIAETLDDSSYARLAGVFGEDAYGGGGGDGGEAGYDVGEAYD